MFTHICQCLLAVCFCVFFFLSLYVTRQDGIFIRRLICLLRLILSCILCGCEMYISVHLIMSVTALSQCFKICVLLCLRTEREADNEEREMTSVIRFVSSSSGFCSAVGRWITVCVLCSRHQYAPKSHLDLVRDVFGVM